MQLKHGRVDQVLIGSLYFGQRVNVDMGLVFKGSEVTDFGGPAVLSLTPTGSIRSRKGYEPTLFVLDLAIECSSPCRTSYNQ